MTCNGRMKNIMLFKHMVFFLRIWPVHHICLEYYRDVTALVDLKFGSVLHVCIPITPLNPDVGFYGYVCPVRCIYTIALLCFDIGVPYYIMTLRYRNKYDDM
jgi:hypothetical protein